MHNEAFSKSVYAVLAELLYFLEIKKKNRYRKICVLVAAYIDTHPAKENSIIYVSTFGYCRITIFHAQ